MPASWETMRKREEAEEKRLHQAQERAEAEAETAEALRVQTQIAEILHTCLNVRHSYLWHTLEDRRIFDRPCPLPPTLPQRPYLSIIPAPPAASSIKYQPTFDLLDRVNSSRKKKKEEDAQFLFKSDMAAWHSEKGRIEANNAALLRNYESQCEMITNVYNQQYLVWCQQRDAFLTVQSQINASIEARRLRYEEGNPDGICDYCNHLLINSSYPSFIPKSHTLHYDADSRMLLVEMQLPEREHLPTLIEVRYVVARDELTEKHLSQIQADNLYDSLIYQIAFRTLHELFAADEIEALDAIVFNGYVNTINRATGKTVKPYLISLQVNRKDFIDLDLRHIDPKACFKQLKGVGSSKLHSMVSIAPIIKMDYTDGRFVDSYDVASQLNEEVNLAAMDWEDFEHLIREIFEKEFLSTGGAVKVTQASRDGGVDAIAYDPDPIRGGKIVIQAKRYTNTVNVSAVRDLYGTVMNEGATKGILVTTSNFGPDSYEFANAKPITLMNGSHLLFLLEKHGHRAKIDLAEARQSAERRSAEKSM